MGGVCIFKDSCRRQESGVGVPGELRGFAVGGAPNVLNGVGG